MDLRGIMCWNVDSVQDKVQWGALAEILGFHKRRGNLLSNWASISVSGNTLFHAVSYLISWETITFSRKTLPNGIRELFWRLHIAGLLCQILVTKLSNLMFCARTYRANLGCTDCQALLYYKCVIRFVQAPNIYIFIGLILTWEAAVRFFAIATYRHGVP
jgi:hypothetical protein